MQLGLCIEMALTSLPFEKRIEKAAELGFKNVEMWFVDDTYKGKPEKLAEILQKNKIKMTNTVIDAPDGSIAGGLTNPKTRQKWLERTKKTLEFNNRAKIPATIVCTGNVVDSMKHKDMMNSVIEGLTQTVDLAEKAGATLLLEPLNSTYDHPGYFLTDSDVAADICRKINPNRLKLLFDCYHMQIMHGDLTKHIEKNLDVIGHFHAAGVPGRNEPSNGEVNYRFLTEKIEKLGYKGVFGLEYDPSMKDEKSLIEVLKYFNKNKE